MKKKSLILFLFACTFVFGQNKKMDSLNFLLNAAKEDTSRLHLYLSLGEECDTRDKLKYAESAIQLADKLLPIKTLAKLRNNILKQKARALGLVGGFHYRRTGNIPLALEYWHKSFSINDDLSRQAKQHGNKNDFKEAEQARFDAFYQIAYIYGERDTTNMLLYNNKLKEIAEDALKQAKQSGNKQDYIDAQKLSAGALWNLEQMSDGNLSKQLECCEKILAINEDIKDTGAIASSLNLIAIVYQEQKDYLKALDSYTKSLNLFNELKNTGAAGMVNSNIGSIYEDKGDFSTALDYYTKSLTAYASSWVLGKIGRIYFKKKDYTKAEKYFNRALDKDKESGNLYGISDNAKALSDVYRAQKKYEKTLDMYELHIKMRDSTKNEGMREAATKKQFQIEYDEKIKANKAEQAKLDAIALEQKQKQQIIIYSVAGILLMVVIFSTLLYKRFRFTNKQKQVIEIKSKETEQQKLIIEEKNKEVMDSIRYAKRIQTSLLPTDKYIDRILTKHAKRM